MRPFLFVYDHLMTVTENFSFIHKEIARAAKKTDRTAGNIALVAASKNQNEAKLDEALAFGHRLFGENKVQEAQAHWAHRRTAYTDLRVHLIGPLQTNKAKDAVALFDLIETLDREKLADALAEEMQKQAKSIPVYIQVNTGEEDQKSGVLPKDFDTLYRHATQTCGLSVTGLMCVPPVDEPPSLHFALLAQMARDYNLPNLSMGMSADLYEAIACGATHVRIGTSLFGER